jgi:hypothetical protein
MVILAVGKLSLVGGAAGGQPRSDVSLQSSPFTLSATNNTSCLTIVLRAECDPCVLMKPIPVAIVLSNVTSEIVSFPLMDFGRGRYAPIFCGLYELVLADDHGKTMPLTEFGRRVLKGFVDPGPGARVYSLGTGESLKYHFPADMNEIFQITTSGVYRLTLSGTFLVDRTTNTCTAVSAPLRIEVRHD